ncbi:MAG: P-II family nitrogen regulator, partial [Aquificae bacterium]|nr:P-II family nitrogen regulator [Aquificota bacterium]
MREVFGIVRKEKSYEMKRVLTERGIAYVSWNVKGRGKEGGLRYRGFIREKVLMPFLPKTAFLVWSDKPEEVVELFLETAHTGAYGDGKVFVIDSSAEVSEVKMVKAIV